MQSSELIQAELRRARESQRAAREDPAQWPFREAAAVLSRFEPDRLHPNGGGAPGWSGFLDDAEPVALPGGGNWWRLQPEIRRATLRRLKTRKLMLGALTSNPERPDDAVQRQLERILRGREEPLQEMTREDLVATSAVLEWLDGILEDLPSVDAIRRALPLADLLEPMRRLADTAFVGRKSELQRLREYVGVHAQPGLLHRAHQSLRQAVTGAAAPPLLIHGTGGVGKSTLLARFILDHVDTSGVGGLPFVYLNLDRPTLNPERPGSLLAEAARQLSTQLPAFGGRLMRTMHEIDAAERRFDSVESVKSLPPQGMAAELLSEALAGLTSPVLVVIDTFEEAQFLGAEVTAGIGQTLLELRRAPADFRIVIAGRSTVREFPVDSVPLGDLGEEEADALLKLCLRADLKLTRDLVEEIRAVAGRNPMSLRLAATFVNEHGPGRLKDERGRSWLALRVRAEARQARLYGRILAHLHGTAVGKLAFPGLVLRRITPEVVQAVLAPACNLDLAQTSAHALVEQLAREGSLVERDDDGALVHRQDVRRQMLRDLTDEVSADVMKRLHDLAVEYYSAEEGAVAAAEEIYHRLMRGDDPSRLDYQLSPDVLGRLRSALQELPAPAELWLSAQLGKTPDPRLRAKADLEQWEELAAVSARRYLGIGDAKSALKVIRERRERSESSPLFHLELEALRHQKRLKEAAKVAENALRQIRRGTGASSVLRDVLLQYALIEESQGRPDAALLRVEQANETLSVRPRPVDALTVLIPRIRLLRKLGEERDVERRRVVGDALTLLTPDTVQDLAGRPALFREVAAELGAIRPDLLQSALETLGLEITDDQLTRVTDTVVKWNARLQRDSDDLGELAVRAGLTTSDPVNWREYLGELGTSGLGRTLVNWRTKMDRDIQTDKALVEIYRANVERAL